MRVDIVNNYSIVQANFLIFQTVKQSSEAGQAIPEGVEAPEPKMIKDLHKTAKAAIKQARAALKTLKVYKKP